MAMIEIQKCPECGHEEAVPGPSCECGYTFPPSLPGGQETPSLGKPKPKLWMALLPGLATVALVMGMVIPRWLEFSQVAGVITSDGSGKTSVRGPIKCVDVYAITLKTSEFYVPENRLGGYLPKKNAARDLSTVLEGMARNRCGEPLKRVKIRIDVRDGKGGRGTGWAEVGDLAAGQAKAFERAWMALVTSYEIVEIR